MNLKNWLSRLCRCIINAEEPKVEITKILGANGLSIIVTREYLISLLRAWQQDKITTAEFYKAIKWLSGVDTKFLDWENGNESITSNIIAYFKRLDLDFITQEAIVPAIEFLNTPMGKFEEGVKKWYQFEHQTSLEERIEKLKGQYPYMEVK